MSFKKKFVASIIVLAIIAIVGYFLISAASSVPARGGNEGGGLGSVSIRTIVTLSVVGGSAFITGFGIRDVIGRAVAARQRSRAKSMQQPVRR